MSMSMERELLELHAEVENLVADKANLEKTMTARIRAVDFQTEVLKGMLVDIAKETNESEGLLQQRTKETEALNWELCRTRARAVPLQRRQVTTQKEASAAVSFSRHAEDKLGSHHPQDMSKGELQSVLESRDMDWLHGEQSPGVRSRYGNQVNKVLHPSLLPPFLVAS